MIDTDSALIETARITAIVNYLLINNISFSLRNYTTPEICNMITEITAKKNADKVKYFFPQEFEIKYDNRQSKIAVATFSY